MIQSRNDGDNITIMNTMSSHFKDESGAYHECLMATYKDLDTGIKYKEEIVDPEYEYYIAKPDKRVSYNRLFIDKNDVEPVVVEHINIEKDIAKRTGNKKYFYDNISSNNRRENMKLHTLPDVFNSDMNIEDYYRFKFDSAYKNDICSVTKSFLDIEADTISMVGDFPEPGECPINAVTVIFKHLNKAFTFLLRNKTNPLIEEFEKEVNSGTIFPELKEFVINAVGDAKKAHKYGVDELDFSFLFYDAENEILMIRDIFKALNTYRPDFCLAWNMSFDIPYIMARIKNLGEDPAEVMCDKDFDHKFCSYFVDERMKSEFAERGDFALISSYVCYLDQMIHFASRRKGRNKFASFSLDAIGEAVAKVRKLDYKDITTNIADLPYKNYKTFVFYNIMDVIVQVCIEVATGDLDYVFNKALVNNTRYCKVHRQTVYLTNRGIKTFFKEGYIMGNNCNKFNPPPDTKFPGAFVADPLKLNDYSRMTIAGIPVCLFMNLVDYDYARLYPSIICQFNVAAHTQIGMLLIDKQIIPYENRQRSESYSRGGQFMEDFQSHEWLEICTRWFNMPNYTQLHSDVITFFRTIMSPVRGLKSYNDNGIIEPMHFDMHFEENQLIESPMIFDDFRHETYMAPNLTRMEESRKYAIAHPNQKF